MATAKKEKRGVILNPHVWAIVFIIIIVTLAYYGYNVFPEQGQKWSWRLLVFEFNYDFLGSLFSIPLIYVALIFWWRGILITWLITLGLILPRMIHYSPDTVSFIINLVYFLIPLMIVITIVILRNWKEMVKKAAAEREALSQAYIAKTLEAQEDERTRISREIHDDTTQELWILANSIQNIITLEPVESAPQIAAGLRTIKDEILRISDDARRLSLALRPGILDDLGLVPALRWLIDQLNKEFSVKANLTVSGSPHEFPPETSIHIFRIVQEALSNVRRHAEATQVIVSVEFTPNTTEIIISDDGKGFPFQGVEKLNKSRLGIVGMQERARLLGGSLNITSKPGKGTTLKLSLKDRHQVDLTAEN